MALYYSGYEEARRQVDTATPEELLGTLDALQGRHNLKYGDGIEAVREEARRQLRVEFTDTSSKEYEQGTFWSDLHAATKAGGTR